MISSGYYGEEFDGYKPNITILKNCIIDINTTLSLESDTEKINFLLKKEYDYLLAHLLGKKYILGTVSKKILLRQMDYYKKTNLEEYYVDYNLPRGIVVQQDDSYRLIDGYHRVKASNEDEVKVWIAS